jgi:tRNA(Ile)-lysidine synthetase-like protein
MFYLHKKVKPREIKAVACSGGMDSMVLLHFLTRNHNVDVLFFHHGTKTSDEAYEFLKDYCDKNKLNLIVAFLKVEPEQGCSLEAFWRDHRYGFLNNYNGMVATAHHLNDAIETWLFTSIHGNPRLIPVVNKNVVRPFILVSKDEIRKYQMRHKVPYIEDLSNYDVKHPRNRIRHKIIPEILLINSGINKTIRKKYIAYESAIATNSE